MTTKITTTCKQCNAKLAVSSGKSGKLLRCPQCHYPLKVPNVPNEGENSAKESEEEILLSDDGIQPQNGMIIVSQIEAEPETPDTTVKIRRCNGGSIRIGLGGGYIVNEHSSICREWITVVDPTIGAELTPCDGFVQRQQRDSEKQSIGLITSYNPRSDYEIGGYYYKSRFEFLPYIDLSAYQVKFLTFNIWGEHVATLVATEISDIVAGKKCKHEPQWVLHSENEASEFLASIAFIARVRTLNGRVLTADTRPVMEEARRFAAKFEEHDFEPTTRKP